MPKILYVCKNCEENYNEGCCFPREDLRVLPDGSWVCHTCYDDAPWWTFIEYPKDEDAEQPFWNDLPAVPEYGPVT
jgi:hypothetical protein